MVDKRADVRAVGRNMSRSPLDALRPLALVRPLHSVVQILRYAWGFGRVTGTAAELSAALCALLGGPAKLGRVVAGARCHFPVGLMLPLRRDELSCAGPGVHNDATCMGELAVVA